jgi:hypothetical protein
MPSTTQMEMNVEALRRCLQRMTETELLRFGQAAKYICSQEVTYGPPCEVPILQLKGGKSGMAQTTSWTTAERIDIAVWQTIDTTISALIPHSGLTCDTAALTVIRSERQG